MYSGAPCILHLIIIQGQFINIRAGVFFQYSSSRFSFTALIPSIHLIRVSSQMGKWFRFRKNKFFAEIFPFFAFRRKIFCFAKLMRNLAKNCRFFQEIPHLFRFVYRYYFREKCKSWRNIKQHFREISFSGNPTLDIPRILIFNILLQPDFYVNLFYSVTQ